MLLHLKTYMDLLVYCLRSHPYGLLPFSFRRGNMELSSGGEGPALLQLHNWTPSQLQLKLSDFREAFISPTRELLLLLSYHCEASLLPLFSGELNLVLKIVVCCCSSITVHKHLSGAYICVFFW